MSTEEASTGGLHKTMTLSEIALLSCKQAVAPRIVYDVPVADPAVGGDQEGHPEETVLLLRTLMEVEGAAGSTNRHRLADRPSRRPILRG
jgi:hypothetical protein